MNTPLVAIFKTQSPVEASIVRGLLEANGMVWVDPPLFPSRGCPLLSVTKIV